MSLNGSLNVGRSALVASQAALQVAGNNMANAATEGFHRRSIHMSPLPGELVGRGHIIGRGVGIAEVRREVDTALQARLRAALSDENAAGAAYEFLNTIETLQNELTDNDLSSLVSDFLNSFSELANNPLDQAVRAVVIQQGTSLTDRIASIRAGYSQAVVQLDKQIGTATERVNDLLDQIEEVSGHIVRSENGVGEASALRDERDRLINELSTYMDVTVFERDAGSMDIHVNSIPIFLENRSRGVEFRSETVDGELEVSMRVAADGSHLDVRSGFIGGLLEQRDPTTMPPVAEAIEDFATQLIFQVNRIHSQGQGLKGFEAVTGTYAVADTTANLNSDDANLSFRIENGSFFVHVTHQDSGVRTSHRINVDGDAMSMDDLIDEINTVVGVPNVTAGLSASNQLTLTGDQGYEISFSDDASGVLAALGVNTFFEGDSALTIAVNDRLVRDPSLLAAGADHVPGSNGTARALAQLNEVSVDELGGVSLREFWQNSVNTLAVQTGAAAADVESSGIVRSSLEAQIQAASGVSLDEESINLLTFQRQFQAAARFITVIDEALQVLLSIA